METVLAVFLKLNVLIAVILSFVLFSFVIFVVSVCCSCFTYRYVIFSCNIAQYCLWTLIQIFYRLTFKNVKITGLDKIEEKKNYVFVCNHLGAFDFFLTTEIMRIKNLFMQVRYILKEGFLRMNPFAYAMRAGGHCFLSRDFELDRQKILNLKNKLNTMKNKSIIIYPEGTRITQRAKDQSDLFCENNNLQKMTHTLYPRKKGFNLIRDEMRDTFPEIISLTYTVEKDKIPSLWKILLGGIDNTQITIDINKYQNRPDTDIATIFYDMNKIIELRKK